MTANKCIEFYASFLLFSLFLLIFVLKIRLHLFNDQRGQTWSEPRKLVKWTQKVGHNWKVQMKKEFSLEEKMSAIGFVFQGESARSVSRRLHLGHHILYEWIERYKLLGIEGLKLKSKKKKRLSYEEKCKIVCEYQESELTLFQLSAKYQLSSSIIGNWVKLVERNGFEALESRRSRNINCQAR